MQKARRRFRRLCESKVSPCFTAKRRKVGQTGIVSANRLQFNLPSPAPSEKTESSRLCFFAMCGDVVQNVKPILMNNAFEAWAEAIRYLNYQCFAKNLIIKP